MDSLQLKRCQKDIMHEASNRLYLNSHLVRLNDYVNRRPGGSLADLGNRHLKSPKGSHSSSEVSLYSNQSLRP